MLNNYEGSGARTNLDTLVEMPVAADHEAAPRAGR
jgi:hypothetical protein